MATNSVENILAGAKKTLEQGSKFTQSVEGKPDSSFSPKKPVAPKIPQAHEASYAMAHQQRATTTGDEMRAKADNVNRYMEATKQQ